MKEKVLLYYLENGYKSQAAELIDKMFDEVAKSRKANPRGIRNTVSERFYTNPAYLSRIFKSEMGRNFNDYLTGIRMEAAAKLLEQEDLRMNDISEMLGYENMNYFLKKFKEHFNCTPTEYRKRLRPEK